MPYIPILQQFEDVARENHDEMAILNVEHLEIKNLNDQLNVSDVPIQLDYLLYVSNKCNF